MNAPLLDASKRSEFETNGWTVVRGLLTQSEVDDLRADCMRLLRREIPVHGRDYCDMTGSYEKRAEDFEILNVMLPRRYHPAWQHNVYEVRARKVAEQLLGSDIGIDYDQLVCKPPHKAGAVFHWHQDLAYWPKTDDPRTATFWLALDVVDADNGSVHFVDGSHREHDLRPHRPLFADRGDNHSLLARLEARDQPRTARLQPGDCTIHHERTLHGSPGNASDRWRRGYVLAFRSLATIERERAMGFTHSHNDDPALLARIAEDTKRTGSQHGAQ
jgi:ectoine hydroxylase-related dioxygenase (phytanoyl-CoA dioxygenase family)